MKTVAALAVSLLACTAATARIELERIKLPPGFQIEVFAEGVKDARSMAPGDEGTLFVSTRTAGNVYAIKHDGKKSTQVITIARGMNMPNGVAMKDGSLYVAEVDRILRYDEIEKRLDNPPQPVQVYRKYPSEKHHGWKFIRFGPDGWLYVPVGAPCNICEKPDPYSSITRLKPDGSAMEVYARGVRNSVGFDWDPRTKELWFTDNGRDMLGDDQPPDELNRVASPGQNFGYPYCHGGTIRDPDFGAKHACGEFAAPAQNLGPHVASLGMRFYTGTQFPAEYRNQVFIAEHGSWNRSRRIGYRVTLVRLDEQGRAVGYEPFAEGWLQGESAWGRPADVAVAPDGSLLVSDDTAGAIYRIRYVGRQ